jgi:dTDP-4-amino-4,6-dideoxygalactose transaminase
VNNRRAAFEVVDAFERAVATYTGAPYAVAVDSCTNALFLALLCWRAVIGGVETVYLPKRTYVGVAQVARNAGLRIVWRDIDWTGQYRVEPIDVWDAAKRFTSGMWRAGDYPGRMVCVSFQAGKLLPIGRGGAILTDSAAAVAWLKRARFDGRTEGDQCDEAAPVITAPGWHMYLDPPSAARGLWLMTYLPEHQPDQVDSYPDLSQLECFR